jgi:lipopolysaccharide/colanic/teichoic acid biosynthesis glycosyltransferase
MLKLRTMRREACVGPEYGGEQATLELWRLLADPNRYAQFQENHKLKADPRVTRFGQFLRDTSLDELPQLVNVLRGHISLVGPRAITLEEFEQFDPEESRLGLQPYWEIRGLRPGLTGLWQISGRSDLSYDARLRLDMVYASSQSFQLDLLLVAKTARALLSRSGAG